MVKRWDSQHQFRFFEMEGRNHTVLKVYEHHGNYVIVAPIESVPKELIVELLGEDRAIMYTDPPWSDSNAKFWATMLKKDTGVIYTPPRYVELLEHLARFFVFADFVFVEASKYHVSTTVSVLQKYLHNISVHKVYYKAGDGHFRENRLVAGSTSENKRYEPNVDGMRGGLELPLRTIEPIRDSAEYIFDPFCGRGLLARVAKKLSMKFIGIEINEKRAMRAVEVIKKM